MKLKLNQVLQQYTGNREELEVNGITVKQCLDDLVKRFPDMKNWLYDANGEIIALVFINGDAINPKELSRPVKENDEIYILTMIGGG